LDKCETAINGEGNVDDFSNEGWVMKRNGWLRRDFNLGALGAGLLGTLGLSTASAQQQVITSTGKGMEGEITSTGPHRRRGQAPNNVPPPGSAPAPGTAPAATILVLGDSLSAEYGIPRGKGWVALLADKLQAERPDVRVVNASISGDTTAGGRARLPAMLDQVRPVQVVIELGGNDALRGLDLDSTQNNLEAMIQACRAVNARVVLVGMQIPPNYGPDYSAKFSVMFANLAKKYRTGLVPFFLKGIADVPDAAAQFQPDRIHPKAEAHPRMLTNVWPEIKKNL
jgi:acyl-CoA thioesterase-1